MPFSVYGNAMIPPVAPIADGTGGPIFNGPHAADPSWNSLIKMVSNSTENNGPQTVIFQFLHLPFCWNLRNSVLKIRPDLLKSTEMKRSVCSFC